MNVPKLHIFISSVLAGHGAERRRVAEALRGSGIADDWIFEEGTARACSLEDSYLGPLRNSDLMVLLLKDDITDPVLLEYRTAGEAEVPVLIFVDAGVAQLDRLREFLGNVRDQRYVKYDGLDDLAKKVIAALSAEVCERFHSPTGAKHRPTVSVDQVDGDLVAGTSHIGSPPPGFVPSAIPDLDFRAKTVKGDVILTAKIIHK
jgi:hypothetical protein